MKDKNTEIMINSINGSITLSNMAKLSESQFQFNRW